MIPMRTVAIWVMAILVGGCAPHVVIEQTKPFDINVNFTGHLDVTIHAEKDLETITGEKPVNKVRPEDIGLPAEAPAGGGGVAVPVRDEVWVAVKMPRAREGAGLRAGEARLVPVGVTEDAKAAMKARDAQIRGLWDGKLVGESHAGLVVARGTLTAEQQKLMDAENADRLVIYKSEAEAQKGTVEAVGLIYYQARLGYAKAGAWYEKRNASSGVWEWKQWGM